MNHNSFFSNTKNTSMIQQRIAEVENGKVGLYSIGLYPASLAYNCVMQKAQHRLLLAPRPGREILGAFSQDVINGMDKSHISKLLDISHHREGSKNVPNNLSDLILRCELVILSSNSNHIESDLAEAQLLRKKLNREHVVLACLSGSFCHSSEERKSYVLCEKEPLLGFFSGFHRHDALRNPLDSFTANFCHPNALESIFGARLLDKLSPNIQVSSGVHNLESQYIKAAKNISSILAGFAYTFHENNPGFLPTVLTLLLNQCLDQAATVSMLRNDRDEFYNTQPFPITELGYGVEKIEATLIKDGNQLNVRDHTFSQLTAMVADVRGSMMPPNNGSPTRNFKAGQILATKMNAEQRCPYDLEEFYNWCESFSLNKGGLEGIKSLKYWPQIVNSYGIKVHDSSMVNLLYLSILGDNNEKKYVFNVMSKSREFSNYCQESVRPNHSIMVTEALDSLENNLSLDFISNLITNRTKLNNINYTSNNAYRNNASSKDYMRVIELIAKRFG